MEPVDSSPPPRDTPEKCPRPSPTGKPEAWFVSFVFLIVALSDLESQNFLRDFDHITDCWFLSSFLFDVTKFRVKGFRRIAIDRDLGERFMNQVQENATSILEFSLQWEEYDKEMELREISMRKQIVELKERLRLVEERERKTEEEFNMKLFLEANVMRLFFQMQSEEVVFAQLKTHEKLINLMNSSMMKKHEELMRELEMKKEEVALLSKSIEEKSCDLEMKVKDFDLKQTAETELMEISRKKLEARENELILFNDTIREKEENFQLKHQAEAKEMDMKNTFLKLKQKEIEERSIQAKTCKRCRLESEHSLLEEKGRYAESLICPRKKHIPIREHNHNDEDKKKDCSMVVSPATSSHVQISEAREREIEEAVSTDGIDEDHMPLVCFGSEFNDFSKTISSFVAGQVWALYDSIDSMPRIYCRIEKIAKSGSFLLTRIEPKDEDPPVSCGMFEWGSTETIKSHLAFSHVMHPLIYDSNSIAMIPRKGEMWALFSDWSKSWNNNPEQHKPPYRYDFVEVVVDFNDCLGIGVAYLGKVEGFVSVYKQADKHGVVSLMISPEEMPRFSHRVPSFKLNGEEKEGVPAGSFELDSAAISSFIPQRRHSICKEPERN